jgi:hypothetical protein
VLKNVLLIVAVISNLWVATSAKADNPVRLKLYVQEDRADPDLQTELETAFMKRLDKVNNIVVTNGECDATLVVHWFKSGKYIIIAVSFHDVYFSRQYVETTLKTTYRDFEHNSRMMSKEMDALEAFDSVTNLQSLVDKIVSLTKRQADDICESSPLGEDLSQPSWPTRGNQTGLFQDI